MAERSVGRHPLARGVLIGAALTLAMTLFVVQNTGDTRLHWLWFDFEARLWAALSLAFASGAVASPLLLAAWRRGRRSRKERLTLTRRLRGKTARKPNAGAGVAAKKRA